VATALQTQDSPQFLTPRPTRFRHQRLRDALREIAPLDGVASVSSALRELFEQGYIDLPLPGSKETRTRFRCLVELGAHDLSLARLAESHADALSILHEAGREPVQRSIYGVWSGRSREQLLRAECTSQGWLLHGELPNCVGMSSVDRVLVVARLPETMVFDVPRSALGNPDTEPYRVIGLAAAESCSVHLAGCQLPVDALVGSPGFYTSRRGLWSSAIDTAACWMGGAVGIYRSALNQLSSPNTPDPHAQRHIGSAYASLSAAGQVLHDAAHAIDAGESSGALQRRALWTRHVVAQSCINVLDSLNQALSDTPLSFDAGYARHVADLPVYLNQSQCDRDLAALGDLVSKLNDASWL
jgi:hypothetical protein